MNEYFKSFLFGAFIFISLASFCDSVRKTGKGKELVSAIIYILITLIVALLFLFHPDILKRLSELNDIASIMNINNLIWFLFGFIGLAVNV